MKTVILYQRPESTFDIKHKAFQANEAALVEPFINEKTSAGFICHEYAYQATYKVEKKTIKTISS